MKKQKPNLICASLAIAIIAASGIAISIPREMSAQTVLSVSVQSLSPSTTVSIGTAISFALSTSGFSSPAYAIADSMSGSTINSGNINASGQFNWTPSAQDAGTHNLTITITDSSGNRATTVQTLTVNNSPSISIQSMSPATTTIHYGKTLSWNVTTSGIGNPYFTVNDYFSGTTITNSNMDMYGNFKWTPKYQDIGLHYITVYARDPLTNITHTASQQITVGIPPDIAIQSLSASTITAGQTVTFNVVTSGIPGAAFSLKDSFPNSTAGVFNIDQYTGNFSWTSTARDVGLHILTITANNSDASKAASTTQYITVTNDAAAAVIPSVPAITPSNPIVSTPIPSASSGEVFTTYLSEGMTSAEVKQLQLALTKLGFFNGPATGYFGPLTTKAVKSLQKSYGITQLGAVGPATRSLLNHGPTTSVPMQPSPTTSGASAGYNFTLFLELDSTGKEVTELQKKLTALKFYSGPITGTFGSHTEAAVKKLQKANGLTAAGYVGPSTRAVLNK